MDGNVLWRTIIRIELNTDPPLY